MMPVNGSLNGSLMFIANGEMMCNLAGLASQAMTCHSWKISFKVQGLEAKSSAPRVNGSKRIKDDQICHETHGNTGKYYPYDCQK